MACHVVAVGVLGWWLAWPSPPNAPSDWLASHEISALYDEITGWPESQRGAAGSYSAFQVGEDGRLVVETLYTSDDLPAAPPPRSRQITQEERHAADLAFARGEAAYERFRQETGIGAPGRMSPHQWSVAVPVDREPPIADIEVDCVRVVVTPDGLDRPDRGSLEELTETIARRVEAWLEDPASGDVCTLVRGGGP